MNALQLPSDPSEAQLSALRRAQIELAERGLLIVQSPVQAPGGRLELPAKLPLREALQRLREYFDGKDVEIILFAPRHGLPTIISACPL